MKLGWLASRSALSRERAFHRACDSGDRARDQRDWSSAARHYKNALELNPDALHIAVQLGHAYKEMGHYDAAARQYYEVLSSLPTDDDLHLQIGHIEKLRGNLSVSYSHYKTAASLNPSNEDVRLELEVAHANSLQEAPQIAPHQLPGIAAEAPPTVAPAVTIAELQVVHADSPEETLYIVSHQLPANAPEIPQVAPTLALPAPPISRALILTARPASADGCAPQSPLPNGFLARAKTIEEALLDRAENL